MIIKAGTKLGTKTVIFDCKKKTVVNYVMEYDTKTNVSKVFKMEDNRVCITNSKCDFEIVTLKNCIAINTETKSLIK